MLQNKHECFWCAKRAGVTAIAMVLGVLILYGNAASSPKTGGTPLPAAPTKDDTSSQVYQHTYDEVFQAAQEAIERMGLFVTDKNKDKGTISGKGAFQPRGWNGAVKYAFDIHIEALNTKPETRVTINARPETVIKGAASNALKQQLSIELQKVLSTYH